jgi:hypothetical protein
MPTGGSIGMTQAAQIGDHFSAKSRHLRLLAAADCPWSCQSADFGLV